MQYKQSNDNANIEQKSKTDFPNVKQSPND